MFVWEKVKEQENFDAPLAATSAFYHHKDKLYVFGGYYEKDNETSNEFFEYNLIKKEWRRIDEKLSPNKRMGTTFSFLGGDLYLFSGWVC